MKNIILIALLTVATLSLNAQTNTNTVAVTAPTLTLEATNADKGMPMELTLGGGGTTVPSTGETSFGVDLSLSVQPFSAPIWFGIAQGLAWEPSLSGSTDLDSTYSFPILKKLFNEKLYVNAGWSVGVVYDRHTVAWRSGPELALEYYTSGNAFIILGANYDLINGDRGGFTIGKKENPLRFSFGIGIAF